MLPLILLLGWIIALVVSGIGPYDRLTWFLEVAPVLIAVPILAATRRRFPLTGLLYVLIFIHGLVLIDSVEKLCHCGGAAGLIHSSHCEGGVTAMMGERQVGPGGLVLRVLA